MASTPKSIRKMRKLSISRRVPSTITTITNASEFDADFLSTRCTSCYQLSSTIKTTTLTTTEKSCCCCCCCCCGGSASNNNNNQQQPNQIYLARSNSGYKLVQVIDDKVMQRRKMNNDIKSKYNKYYLNNKKNKLPLSLQPVVEKISVQKQATTVSSSSSYDVSCNQIVNCNGYLKKFIEKTKKNLKKKTVDDGLAAKEQQIKNINEKFDSIKKRKISLFQRKAKKSLVKENEFKMESIDNVLIENSNNNSDMIENRSYVQESYLSDFNQFGQFRVWYV
jgi:hypothetical protein